MSSSRRRTLPWALGSVLLLALVIYGTSALTSAQAPQDVAGRTAEVQAPSDSPGSAARSESLYQQALEAQRSGDATRALELAAQSLQVSSDNAKAKQLVETLTATAGSATSNGGGSAPSTGTGAPVMVAPTQPRVADIATLLPKTISGYSRGTPQIIETDAVVTADPEATSPDAGLVATVLFSVHDRGSAAAAKTWVDTVNKRVYAQNRVAVTIAGGPGYFATDGTRLSTAVFARGPYVFELILTVSQGKPVATRNVALRLAEAFPVKH